MEEKKPDANESWLFEAEMICRVATREADTPNTKEVGMFILQTPNLINDAATVARDLIEKMRMEGPNPAHAFMLGRVCGWLEGMTKDFLQEKAVALVAKGHRKRNSRDSTSEDREKFVQNYLDMKGRHPGRKKTPIVKEIMSSRFMETLSRKDFTERTLLSWVKDIE